MTDPTDPTDPATDPVDAELRAMADRARRLGLDAEVAPSSPAPAGAGLAFEQTPIGVDPAHAGPHVDYEDPGNGAIPPSADGWLRLSVGDEAGAVYVDVPRAELEPMTAGQLGLQVFEMLRELDARTAARAEQQEEDGS